MHLAQLVGLIFTFIGTGIGFYIGWNLGYKNGVIDCADQIMLGWKKIMKEEKEKL